MVMLCVVIGDVQLLCVRFIGPFIEVGGDVMVIVPCNWPEQVG